MALLVFEHHPADPPARLGQILRDHGHRLRIIQLHRGQPLPPDLDDVDGVISLGGPMNVDEPDQHPWMSREIELIREAHERDLPVVGLCLGAQLIATALGGEVAKMAEPEIGFAEVQLAFPGTMEVICAGVPWKTQQFHAHGYEVTKLPPGATPLAGSKQCRNQAFKVGLKTYAFQYHPEWAREQIDHFLDRTEQTAAKGGFGAGIDIPAVRAAVDERYPMFRHLGDRLCNNLAAWLFPLDKRRTSMATIEPVANFHPARS